MKHSCGPETQRHLCHLEPDPAADGTAGIHPSTGGCSETRVTHPADETLGVPEATQRRDVVLQNGSSTTAAFGRKHVEVILPAVGFTVLLMKTFAGSQTEALNSHETRTNKVFSST